MAKAFSRMLRIGLVAAGLALSACTVAQAQVTSLTMSSDAGDYIGQGQTYNYTPVEGAFSAQVNYQGGVSISYTGNNYSHWWYLDFAAPNGAPLTSGTYFGAIRFPFNSGVPGLSGLSVSGDGRGCNTLTGSFNVLQVEYGPNNTVNAFDATFEQHCEGAPAALKGEIRYNASVPLYLSAPTNLQLQTGQTARFTVTATDVQQRKVKLSASALPTGASFVDLGNNQGTFTWTPTSTQTGTFVATFVGDNLQGNVATTSTQLTVIPPPPYNDDISNPGLINTVPATASQVVTTATTASDDPYCFGNAQSVWYAFTAPSTKRIEINSFGSSYDTSIGVYTGTRGGLTQVACNGDSLNGFQSRVRFDAVAGTIYYVMVASQYYPSSAANLVLNVQAAPPSFSFSPSVSQFGSVVPSTGAVTLTGVVECSSPSFVSLYGTIRQTQGGSPVSGYWSAWVPCSGVTQWSAPVSSTVSIYKGRSAALFTGGQATVGATASAFDPETGEYKTLNLTTNITLRGK